MYRYLTEETIEEMFREYGTPDFVQGHCRAVSQVSVKLGRALNRCGLNLDIDLLKGAGLVHDVARTSEDHQAVAADMLTERGYTREAQIVRVHMTYPQFNPISRVNETDIVCLADRVVIDDTYVGLNRRMRYIVDKARRMQGKDIRDIMCEKRKGAQCLIDGIETVTGLSLDEIVGRPIDRLLPLVEKPARYMGGEINQVLKDETKCDLRFGFAFPDMYEIGMSYQGLQILYKCVNDVEDIYCERVFAPAQDMEELMRKKGVKLATIETQLPVSDLDILGFTLQYEMSYTNILNMLDLGGIPVSRAQRWDMLLEAERLEAKPGYQRFRKLPLIIAGGPCACNPEPLADFIDLFLVGDGEEQLVQLCCLYRELKLKGSTRLDFLKRAAAEIEGVYVPMFYDVEYEQDGRVKEYRRNTAEAPNRVRKAVIQNLDAAPYPVDPIIPLVETVHDRAVCEAFRGCTRGCRFCQAGMIYRPVRERSPEKILELSCAQLDRTGHDELSLLSLSTSDYSGFEGMAFRLIEECTKRKVSLSLPSLRLDSFSFSVMDRIQGFKKSGLTMAPEAGTQRLRDVINKNITEEDLFGAARQALELGWDTMKLYFMCGLPTETDEDLEGIGRLAREIKELSYDIRGRLGGRFRETVSVSNFIPKPHTPFQWEPQASEEELRHKHDVLRHALAIKGVNYNYHDSETSVLEALFAKGDRRTGRLLEAAWRKGCKFDSWSEYFDMDKWQSAIQETGTDVEFYVNRRIPFDEVLPWDIIDMGVSKEFLIREAQKAYDCATTPDCRGNCQGCGVNQRAQCMTGIQDWK